MGNTNSGVGGVNVLTACTRGAISVDTQIFLADIDLFLLVRFGHNGHCASGGVNTALRLSRRNALNAMGTGFKLELGVDIFTDNSGDNLLVAAMFTLVGADYFHFPAVLLGKFAVHAEQVTGKNSRFVTARAGPYFQKDVMGIVGIFG